MGMEQVSAETIPGVPAKEPVRKIRAVSFLYGGEQGTEEIMSGGQAAGEVIRPVKIAADGERIAEPEGDTVVDVCQQGRDVRCTAGVRGDKRETDHATGGVKRACFFVGQVPRVRCDGEKVGMRRDRRQTCRAGKVDDGAERSAGGVRNVEEHPPPRHL